MLTPKHKSEKYLPTVLKFIIFFSPIPFQEKQGKEGRKEGRKRRKDGREGGREKEYLETLSQQINFSNDQCIMSQNHPQVKDFSIVVF